MDKIRSLCEINYISCQQSFGNVNVAALLSEQETDREYNFNWRGSKAPQGIIYPSPQTDKVCDSVV